MDPTTPPRGEPYDQQVPTLPSSADALITALSRSHDRLVAAVTPLGAAEVVRPAYPSEWSIADTLSHLGSGAEIFTLLFTAAQDGSAGPGQDDFTRVWDVWNAKPPLDQAMDSLTYDAAFLAAVGALSAQERTDFQVTMFNGVQDLAGFLQLRMGEHGVHTWDVRVALDPTETLPADTTEQILPGLAQLVGRTAKPSPEPRTVLVTTERPDSTWVLKLGTEGAELSESDDEAADARLTLPAEAFVRLVYGRLQPDHTPSVSADGVDLEQLRQVFPGF